MKKIWLYPDIMNNMQNTQRNVYQLVALAAKHCPKVLPGAWFSTSLHSGLSILRTLTAEQQQQLGTCTLCSRRHFPIRLVPAYKEPLPC